MWFDLVIPYPINHIPGFSFFLKVYEHVYETVDISSSPEVRANATAKVRLLFRKGYYVKAQLAASIYKS